MTTFEKAKQDYFSELQKEVERLRGIEKSNKDLEARAIELEMTNANLIKEIESVILLNKEQKRKIIKQAATIHDLHLKISELETSLKSAKTGLKSKKHE